jgi:hypothetical protein
MALLLSWILLCPKRLWKGNAYYQKRKLYKEAAEAYETVLTQNKHSSELYFNLGIINWIKVAPSIYNYEKHWF